MLPGRLRDKIEIYAEARTTNDYSERVKSYSLSFPVRAEMSFLSGTELQYLAMADAAQTLRFKVYFKMNKYNERQLIKFRGDYFNIQSIEPDRDRTFTILTADRMPEGAFKIV